jgi:hypothetical protein
MIDSLRLDIENTANVRPVDAEDSVRQWNERERPLSSQRLVWVTTELWFLCQAVLIAWATLAIYYSNLPWPWLRLVMAGVFASL